MRARLLVPCATLVVALVAVAAPAAAAPVPPPSYVAPVDGTVTDPFRPPATRYGPGNRGLTYATSPGAPVRAMADGVVTFAGTVAGSRHATVRHADGVRTSYSFLDTVAVVVGQRVGQGDVVGTAGATFHLGARRGDAYFDPASLLDGGLVRVRLVPFDDPPGAGPGGERGAIGQLIDGVRSFGGLFEGAAGWLRDSGGQLLRTLDHYVQRFSFPNGVVQTFLTVADGWLTARRRSQRDCSDPSVAAPPPAGRRLAVLVAGLGSNSRGSTIDQVRTAALGYAAPDVLRFSYAGGRVPDPTDGLAHLPASAYDAPDTQADLLASGDRLADLVEQVAAAEPGVPIDLYAHSQGGVVARLALIELEDRHGVEWLRRLGLVATLGSPHGGADLATAVHAVGTTESGGAALGVIGHLGGIDLDPDAPNVAQLGETSDVVALLADRRIPDTVRAVSIAARGDVIVPSPRSEVTGATEVIVPLTGWSAHSALVGSDAAHRELALALAGLPPVCQSFGDALLDQAWGEGISYVEDWLGAGAWLLGSLVDSRVEEVRGPRGST